MVPRALSAMTWLRSVATQVGPGCIAWIGVPMVKSLGSSGRRFCKVAAVGAGLDVDEVGDAARASAGVSVGAVDVVAVSASGTALAAWGHCTAAAPIATAVKGELKTSPAALRVKRSRHWAISWRAVVGPGGMWVMGLDGV